MLLSAIGGRSEIIHRDQCFRSLPCLMFQTELSLVQRHFPNLEEVPSETHQCMKKSRAVRIFSGKDAILFGAKSVQS